MVATPYPVSPAALRLRTAAVAAGGLVLALAGAADAQSISSNSASFNAGWGRSPGQDNQGVNPNTRDANGNRVIIDGVIQTGVNQSSISSMFGGGAFSSASGAGSGGATAIGNNLTVITQGNWNTVIVNSVQTNTGAVTATTDTQTGGVGGG